MTVANKLENPTINPMFNDPNADITFCSEDGVHFRLQRKYLEANTGAFPGAEFETRGEIVHLTESAAVLSILFGFTHPKEHPDVEVLAFKTLEAVAEAAEKYEVFFAMNICRLQMKQFLAKHPLEILAHAAKHDYPKLISDVSLYLVRFPLLYVAEQLPSRYTIPWLRYHAKWDSVFGEAAKSLLAIRVAKPSTGHLQSLLYWIPRAAGMSFLHCCDVDYDSGAQGVDLNRGAAKGSSEAAAAVDDLYIGILPVYGCDIEGVC